MIDVVLAFDNLNPRGGDFISACLNDINDYFKNKEHNLITLTSNEINSTSIYNHTSPLNNFIFIPYCHGNETCLANIKSEIFVSTTINITNFTNSFFYTFSCSSGAELGKKLIEKNCKCFFGYNKTIYSIPQYSHFMECANSGIFLFIEGKNTDDILLEMKNLYQDKVYELSKIDFFSAAYLRSNKDSLIKIGLNITINDLMKNA